MQSFRTEIENPVVEKDILDLEKKIREFREGKVDEDKFRSLRLARGVYGQRQAGVQMVRIKLPFGKVTSEQLKRISAVSDEYSTGRLHITTRQDIQIHYVSLDRTPELWAQLEKDDVTLREACGNTIRNITASPTAGIDVNEPFDVSPYAHAAFEFFLRNPICQEMGRKFKISFSATEEDSALSYIHDLGFIAKLQDGKRGFKVMIGGGLGSQPRHADELFDFIEAEKIIPLTESVLRVFDRYGERSKRLKARMKYLIKDIGKDAFMELVAQQKKALSKESVEFDLEAFEKEPSLQNVEIPSVEIKDKKEYETWKSTNVIPQKQEGLFAIGIRVPLGDFYTPAAVKLADLIQKYAGNELRFTLRQDILLRHVREELLPFFFTELKDLGLAEAGYNKTVDITACPGTDTCNLGIASSTGIAAVLEDVLKEEYPEYINGKDITIKISGCMNACGQHNMAEIGFQGMSIKVGKTVAPALQILLGGGVLGDGKGRFSDKIIKIPSKRGPDALRVLLNDFGALALPEEKFSEYYDRQGKTYFYDLLKELADTTNLAENDFIDWGHEKSYINAIGVGECAGVIIDLIATLLFESEEKIENAKSALERKAWADSIYHSYTSIVNSAKALLLAENKTTNTQAGIISLFDEFFVTPGKIELSTSFKEFAYQLNEHEPTEAFANKFLNDAHLFHKRIDAYRTKEVRDGK
ncbi:HEPN domain-containing protein [Gillisia limnaea]|uniref:Nitrite and sulphite reductase 4Fe-4S region n=1 Tax=Gillisia limnaea (strain DSM 15749 / LMG 21470 / R-8282) TaxID=865937 RepID=H2BVX8_GILLR|nr:HEPN domain-containing protein [Gillisia limnaea]EHQ01861.1 nitrite and sulphite reductase 4Fe-4S region [Gillisia limnaea DSM 15749]